MTDDLLTSKLVTGIKKTAKSNVQNLEYIHPFNLTRIIGLKSDFMLLSPSPPCENRNRYDT